MTITRIYMAKKCELIEEAEEVEQIEAGDAKNERQMSPETTQTPGQKDALLCRKVKRRRRSSKPPNAIHKKTEEKDKYWLRAFRKHMRGCYPKLRRTLSPEDQQFWDFFLSHCGNPNKGNK